MPIIKQKDIYDDSKGAFDKLLADLDKLNTEVVTLTKSNDKLAQSLQTVKKTSDGSEAKELVNLTNQLNKSTAKLNTTATEQSRKLTEVKVEQQRLNKVAKEAATLANKNISLYQKESIKLNNLRKEYKELAIQNKQNTAEGKKLLANLTKLDTKLKAVDNTVGQNQRSVGKYGNALKGLGTQLVGGFGLVAAFGLVVSWGKKVFETSTQLISITKKTEQTFGLTGKSAKNFAANILSVANAFDKDYNEILRAANTVSKELGISATEALAHIEEGFLKGSNNSDEFLDILKEYPTQFKAAGIDADTMFAIINQQVKEGIYSDKGVDAIKEGGLRLRENTKAVQEALAPLDESVKKQIEQEIAAGNSFKAIQLVSEALKDTSLTAEETQTIIADVFGGAGEDAGIRYLQGLSDIETNLENVATQATQSEQATLELSKEWNKFVVGVSDDSGILATAWASILGGITSVLETLTKFGNVDFIGKTKMMANGLLTLVGVSSDYQFQVEENTKALVANNVEHGKNTRLTKEQREALAKTEEETVKLTAAQIKAIQAQKDLNAARKSREGFADDIPSTVSGGGVVTSVSDPVADKKSEVDQKLELDQWYLDQKAEQIVIADEVAREDALEREIEFQEAKAELINEFEQLGAQLAIDIFNSIQDEKIAKIQADADTQIKILEDQLDKGVISEEEFTKKKEAIEKRARIKSAEAEKKKAIWEAVIATALAIVKAAPSIIKMALAAVIGGIQIAVIAAKPIPQFAEGEVDIDAPSHALGGKDINIQGGESVIKTKATRDSKGLLNMIQDGIVTDKTPFGNYNDMDMRGLIDKFDENTRETKRTNHLLSNLENIYELDGFLHRKTTAGLETKQPLK